jgi:hypothetical protein
MSDSFTRIQVARSDLDKLAITPSFRCLWFSQQIQF